MAIFCFHLPKWEGVCEGWRGWAGCTQRVAVPGVAVPGVAVPPLWLAAAPHQRSWGWHTALCRGWHTASRPSWPCTNTDGQECWRPGHITLPSLPPCCKTSQTTLAVTRAAAAQDFLSLFHGVGKVIFKPSSFSKMYVYVDLI